MSHINFILPQNKDELLQESCSQYFVMDLIGSKEVPLKLREARQSLKDEGPEFIIEYFPTYFTVFYNADSVHMDLLMRAYEDLHKATKELNKNIEFLLNDKDSLSDETKLKYANILKMLLYIYTNIVGVIEYKNMLKETQSLVKKTKGRRKESDEHFYIGVDKKGVVTVLNYIIQQEINMFWDPPVVEEVFINLIAEICYRFLENPVIKSEPNIRTEIFNTLGTLLKSYSHGVAFVVRTAQLIKTYEHLVSCVATGIQSLVENYNCKSLVRDFVREITEWQTDDNFKDVKSTRHCSDILSEMANIMPTLMMSEVMYLNRYLGHESYNLRNSVLNVIAEIISEVLSKPDLDDEQKEYRDDFLFILEEHLYDISAHVRSKVLQHWLKLQKGNLLSVSLQITILEKVVVLLRDKSAIARKCAASCVTSFLQYNKFGAQLQLKYMEEQVRVKTEEFETLKEKLETSQLKKMKEIEEDWKKKEGDIRKVIESGVDKEVEETGEEIPKDDLAKLVRTYLTDDKYEEAFVLCRTAGTKIDEWAEMRKNMEEDEEVEFYMMLMHTFFVDLRERIIELAEGTSVTEEELTQLESIKNSLQFFKEAESFLILIDSAIKPMKDLLESVSINDMQEAVMFFIAAYQFNIDNAQNGVLEMLNIMKRTEQDRKEIVINAFKLIFLTTDSQTLLEHTQLIVNRLIDLVRLVPFDNMQDLRILISEWTSKGVLDNSVVDMLWKYFTKKMQVSDGHSLGALQLLAMAATGRRTIINRNIKLVSSVAFMERGSNDLLLFAAGCELLAVAGSEKLNITSTNLPFRVKVADVMWENMVKILCDHFPKRTPFYTYAVTNAVNCIFRLCSKPETVCEKLLETILSVINEASKSETIDFLLLLRLNHTAGEIAIRHLNFLDDTVYKELKRRNYVREERRSSKKKQNVKHQSSFRNASSRMRDVSNANSSRQSETQPAEESTLEGAQADDTDAEFILDVLENKTVTGAGGLAKLAPYIVGVCEKPDVYSNKSLQLASITALLRFMIVSSKFCKQHIQLVFTILEKTVYPEVKCNIVIHLSDLLERFPNIVEPWTPRIYHRLSDPNFEVRKTSFFILSNLILKDVILVKSQISIMALCIVEEQVELQNMSKNFFTLLATRGMHLYSILPDIFSHLVGEADLKEDDLRLIMKFLFNLIDKNKQMENLVERFCSKFLLANDIYKSRNIAFCLTLIQYNEKGIRRLIDSFGHYKEYLQENDVYVIFKQIINMCNKNPKNEMKTLANELDEKINSVFDINEDGAPSSGKKPPFAKSKTPFKKPRGKPLRKKPKRTAVGDGDSSGSDVEEPPKSNTSSVRKSNRARTQKKNVVDSDSD